MRIGKYQLIAQKSVEQLGVSYQALDSETKQQVEIRVLHRKKFDERLWEFVKKQIFMASVLDHPTAVQVQETKLRGSNPYFVLEWLENRPLVELVTQGEILSIQKKFSFIEKIVAVLEEAHCMGIVHGNLCPGEINFVDNEIKIDFSFIRLNKNITVSYPLEINYSCMSPEAIEFSGVQESSSFHTTIPQMPTDIYALGAVIYWLITNTPLDKEKDFRQDLFLELKKHTVSAPLKSQVIINIGQLVKQMIISNIAQRPLISKIKHLLEQILLVLPQEFHSTTQEAHLNDLVGESTAVQQKKEWPEKIGRYTIKEKIGEGGMGTVYRGIDPVDSEVVAIKTLSEMWVNQVNAVERFFQEARLLAKVNNPYVANLIEANEARGVYFLVMEYVPGQSIEALLKEKKKLETKQALAIIADVARALLEAHDRGIVHRDIKPANILLASSEPVALDHLDDGTPYAKLSDFGLARHILEEESLGLTQPGTIVGTVFYMSPEQCSSEAADPRADVYAMGVTLFQMLAGCLPFVGESTLAVMDMHKNKPVPSLTNINPGLEQNVVLVVEKALVKDPKMRYANAREFLSDVERLLRGEPTNITLHPKLPACDPRNMICYDFEWNLKSTPQELWPYVSNTERLNRALGMPPVEYSFVPQEGRSSKRLAENKIAGLLMQWEEHPFEWIEAERMGVLREYTKGPLKWFASIVKLESLSDGGARLSHTLRMEPRNTVGKTVTTLQMNFKFRQSLNKAYKKIDSFLQTGRDYDPYENKQKLNEAKHKRIQRFLYQLLKKGCDQKTVKAFGDFVVHASDQEVGRIRPLALANHLKIKEEFLIAACLQGSKEGLLTLSWDILCPVCRIPSDLKNTLQQLKEHSHCPACNLDFKLDFSESIEMVFQISSDIRTSDLRTYCAGGPAHFPHVAAQVRIKPAERIQLSLNLTPGNYRLQGPHLPIDIDFQVETEASINRWDILLSKGLAPQIPKVLKADQQILIITNNLQSEYIVRIEKRTSFENALTAAKVSSLPLFRELFPEEILSPGELVSLSTITLLTTRIDAPSQIYHKQDDNESFSVIFKHFKLLEEEIKKQEGTVIKTVGEGLLAVFKDTSEAVKTGFKLSSILAQHEKTEHLKLKIAIHRGPVLVATINDTLDYFGSTVKACWEMLELCEAGQLVLSHDVATDPNCAKISHGTDMESEIFEASLPGQPETYVLRIKCLEKVLGD